MSRKVQIEVTGPVQDPVTGEVIHQPGTRFAEGAKELDGIPDHMLRPVFAVDDSGESKAEEPKPSAAAAKSQSKA